MCGRYTLAHNHKEIMERFEAELMLADFDVRYNISPTQTVPIVVQETDDQGVQHRSLEAGKWGLIPGWVKDPRLLKPMINARAETIAQKRTFSGAFKKRRCLIPADGFYEWITIQKKRHPVRFQINGGKLFAFAGIYEDWKSPEGERKRTCSIITVAANDVVSPIHDRMPAILTPENERLWLDSSISEPEKLMPMLAPFDNDAIKHYRCSTIVNSSKIDTPECIQPIESEDMEKV